MRGSSADSLARLTESLDQALESGADGEAVGDDLFAAAGVLRGQVALRRAATDPSSPTEAKSGLLRGVFGSHLGSEATDLVAEAGSLRWATGADLVASLERLGVMAVVKSADKAGEGDRLEDELFSFGRTVADHAELRDALSDPARSVADKQGLIRSLLGDKATSGTVRLAAQSVSGAHLTVARALEEYSRVAADARDRLVALVRVAKPLSDREQERLSAVLARDYGRPVHLNLVVEPGLVGGLQVAIGDQTIDGSISSRIDDAKRRLVG
jgi:F-type H+-transporting ATPase subunit delta